ncbi:CoA transferase [Sphingomonas sp. CL5.1]|uniref:CaiB/BaiF CoA-transferase family protein n=1 Tax=Sphingomonas sp. CL5.1 TaxID=2653203 RepID=UPI001C2ECBE9|nr:CoA transferase [Sphingomonas sp. CL5.1]
MDAVTGPLAPITRYLAELGARVDRVASGGSDPFADAAANAGKQAADPRDLPDLLTRAHVVVADSTIDLSEARRANPTLVTMAVSDFGTGNSFTGWQATDPVLHALSGVLCRSGIRGRAPLLPPHGIAQQCAAAQAAYAVLASLYHALRTGRGDHIDFSALEGVVQALDPGYGIGGSATMGRPAKLLSRDRPARGYQYPILPCADGHVRICLLSARQWQGMFTWMGSPAAFADPSFDRTGVRYKSPDLIPAIAAFFASRSRDELERDGQRHGVPIAALASLGEALDTDHFRARGTFRDATLVDGTPVRLPNGMISIDGARMSPAVCETTTSLPTPSCANPPTRAFDGLRVLDLGVIVVGAETSRQFADQGADVVKVESRAFPDGNRQSYLPYDLSVSFAAGHRNKRSLGLDLRDPRGKALFLDMARSADVILSNFKPGTMASLGLDHATLSAVNPGLVTVESSAFGATGPWSARMGYGPLVRAATGLTERWRYPDDPEGYSDSITIYPDHVAARIGAMAAVALLIRRLRTGTGGHAEIAQAEVMLGHFAADVARASANAASDGPPDRPWGVYPAAGDDAWCVITVRDDADWRALAPFLGLADDATLATREGRAANADRLDGALGAWLHDRAPEAAATIFQEAGVPAAPMRRIAELPTFAYYRERDFFRFETHPFLDEEVVAEHRHARSSMLADADSRPAPLAGENTEEVVADWLDLSPRAAEMLVEAGVLQPVERSIYALIDETRARATG